MLLKLYDLGKLKWYDSSVFLIGWGIVYILWEFRRGRWVLSWGMLKNDFKGVEGGFRNIYKFY